jgi:hypothetical protein
MRASAARSISFCSYIEFPVDNIDDISDLNEYDRWFDIPAQR